MNLESFQHCADARVKQCNEMVQGIKVVKLLAWENYVADGIYKARTRELRALMKNVAYKSVYSK